MPFRPRFPICPICNEPVQLTTAVTNEDGKAVHEECYVETVKSKSQQSQSTVRVLDRSLNTSSKSRLSCS